MLIKYIMLELVDQKHVVLELESAKLLFFDTISQGNLQNHGLDHKVSNPKVGFLRPNKVLGAQKSFFWPPKT